MRTKRLEAAKTVLSVLLACSALVLGARVGMYAQLFESSPVISGVTSYVSSLFSKGTQAGGSAQTKKVYTQAAKPFAVVTNAADAGMYAAAWDAAGVELAYGDFSAVLGEALGSAGEPETVSEADFRAALEGTCVYFDFYYPQDLSLLAGWLGTSMETEDAARRILLAQAGAGAALYYIEAESGRCCRRATALSWSSVFADFTDDFPNGAAFAYALGEGYEAADPYSVVLASEPVKNVYAVKNPFRSGLSAEVALSVFSMNSRLATGYTESDGTAVYVEGDYTLRVYPAGEVTFRTSGAGIQVASAADAPTEAECVEAACRMAAACAALCGDGASLYLSGTGYEDGAYVVRFDYALAGLPVVFEGGGPAAEIGFIDGAIAWARVLFRAYERTGETTALLPAGLEAAVIKTAGGGELAVVYGDDGETAAARWKTD